MPDTVETAPAPVSAAPVRLRRCDECGTPFVAKRDHARFCPGDACRKAWNNRNTSRGGPVVPILQAWAMTRHAKPGTREADINRYARRELTAIAREFADQDRAANDGKGRPSPLDYVGAMMDGGLMYVDRAR